MIDKIKLRERFGGQGSGNFGHEGRLGEVGGSGEGGNSFDGKTPHQESGKFKGKMIDDGTTGKSGFGNKVWKFKSPSGYTLDILSSKYSSAMRTGSALGGYTDVTLNNPGSKNIFGDFAKKFKGDEHLEKASKYVKKNFGVSLTG